MTDLCNISYGSAINSGGDIENKKETERNQNVQRKYTYEGRIMEIFL